MPRYVVLLRGINVGRHRRLAMADLRTLLTDLDYTAVKTLLNSGNALVTGPDAAPEGQAARIMAAIEERTGLDVPCVVLTADELRALLAANPFADVADDGSRMMVHVLAHAPDAATVAEHDPVAADPDGARLVDRAVYQWCPDGLLAAPPVGFPDPRDPLVTTRNWNTLTKLAALL